MCCGAVLIPKRIRARYFDRAAATGRRVHRSRATPLRERPRSRRAVAGLRSPTRPVPCLPTSSTVNSTRGSSRSLAVVEHRDDPRDLYTLGIVRRVVVDAVVGELLHAPSQPLLDRQRDRVALRHLTALALVALAAPSARSCQRPIFPDVRRSTIASIANVASTTRENDEIPMTKNTRRPRPRGVSSVALLTLVWESRQRVSMSYRGRMRSPRRSAR